MFTSLRSITSAAAKVVPDLIQYRPKGYTTFIDAFGGGFNVGINMPAARTVYNDVNYLVTSLIRSFRDYDTYEYLLYVRRMIKKFGLEKANADAYIRARDSYNSRPVKSGTQGCCLRFCCTAFSSRFVSTASTTSIIQWECGGSTTGFWRR